MDKLFEFLTAKVNYVVFIILFFLIPGNVLIFVWNKDIYFEVDIVRLLILSVGVAFMVFVPNLMLAVMAIMIFDKIGMANNMNEPIIIMAVPGIAEFCEIGFYVYNKIISNKISIKKYCKFIGEKLILSFIGMLGILCIISVIEWIYRSICKSQKKH